MAHKILLPIDLEQTHDLDDVFAAALEQAAMHDSTFIVLSVLPRLSLGYFPSIERRYMHKITGEAQRHLDRMAQERLGTRFAWSAHVLTGSAGRMIVHAADDHEVNLIVMASHNPCRSDVLLGSVASWVVRHARHSVLVVRPAA
ncbi:universal stress protein [Salinisphaera sp. RV14]|uniref:universal stress protein n=1 Tax=unclassified Salinisphaera TaxID=2649847 RepID=UPI003F85352B